MCVFSASQFVIVLIAQQKVAVVRDSTGEMRARSTAVPQVRETPAARGGFRGSRAHAAPQASAVSVSLAT